jgi:hypothetical protein
VTAQPIWEYVANLGDASPVEYGGLFLYRDTTGGFELEKLEEPCDDTEECELPEVPSDFPVRMLDDDDDSPGRATCGTCDRSWDDSVSTSMTPTPAGRCPFEAYHAIDARRWTVRRVLLDRCQETHVEDEDGSSKVYLVPARYDTSWPHPVKAYVEWFAKDLSKVADCMGTTRQELVTALCSEDGKERAWAYQCIYDYHGWDNGDSYPSTLTHEEVIARYTKGEIE